MHVSEGQFMAPKARRQRGGGLGKTAARLLRCSSSPAHGFYNTTSTTTRPNDTHTHTHTHTYTQKRCLVRGGEVERAMMAVPPPGPGASFAGLPKCVCPFGEPCTPDQSPPNRRRRRALGGGGGRLRAPLAPFVASSGPKHVRALFSRVLAVVPCPLRK
ncbi:hypothetical protein LX36DRAFT_197143 [Colletotrichum falcatum]|nr:hypothetical protein LX36DRAFT_197143 [Colletotrichum falcatum]